MRSRRTFFAKLAAIAATVALAPEIAFGQKVVAKAEFVPFWYQETCVARCYSEAYRKAMEEWATAPINPVDWKKVPFWSDPPPCRTYP